MPGKRSPALIDLCQGEKIKSGLIWITHTVEMTRHIEGPEQSGAVHLITALLLLLLQEVQLAGRLGQDGGAWAEVESFVEKALVMVRSGVVGEASYHLTRALSIVTKVDGRAMQTLRDEGLL
jgi:hypothetical protein